MRSLLFRNRYRVPTARLRGWDYRWPGAYAVTICVKERVCCLGDVVDTEVGLSPFGVIVAEEWLAIPGIHPQVTLDEWISYHQPAGCKQSGRLSTEARSATAGGYSRGLPLTEADLTQPPRA